MARRSKTILTYCILLLLAVALIAYNRFVNSKDASPPGKDYAAKFADLKSDLAGAAMAGNANQNRSANFKPTHSRKSHNTRRK
jgi:hypothetical protein